ncbi:MAG: tyrosine-type recombinase/integrase [Frankia sp.]
MVGRVQGHPKGDRAATRHTPWTRPTTRQTLPRPAETRESAARLDAWPIRNGSPDMTGKRRSHGEGSVYQRASDGLWVGLVDLGYIEGKRRRKPVYGKTEKEALAKMRDLRRAADRGQDLAAKPRTVAEWLNEWLTDYKAHDGTRPATLARYRQVVNTHLVPALGRTKLDKLKPADVHRMLAARRETSSVGTLIKIHSVLRAALGDAERMELVSRNVARSVRVPGQTSPDRRALTFDEARRFLQATEKDRLYALFVVALTVGLRRGELLGLRWTDVDLGTRTLTVRCSVQRAAGQLRIVEPKTRTSRRVIPLPATAVKALEEHEVRQANEREKAGKAWQDNNLIFASTIGTLMEPRNVSRRFTQLRDGADLSWLRLHDLRHATATFLLAAGIEIRTVMEILGHATVRMTLETYGHALPERMRAAADSMDGLLAGEPTEPPAGEAKEGDVANGDQGDAPDVA